MRIKVQRLGDSLALMIPKALASKSKIHEDEFVNVSLEEDKIVIEPVAGNEYSLEYLVGGINKSNLQHLVDFGKSEGNEVW